MLLILLSFSNLIGLFIFISPSHQLWFFPLFPVLKAAYFSLYSKNIMENTFYFWSENASPFFLIRFLYCFTSSTTAKENYSLPD